TLAIDVATVCAVVRAVVTLLTENTRNHAVAAEGVLGTGLARSRAAPAVDDFAAGRATGGVVVHAFAGAVFAEITGLAVFDLPVAALGRRGLHFLARLTGL